METSAPNTATKPILARYHWTLDELIAAQELHLQHTQTKFVRIIVNFFFGLCLFLGLCVLALGKNDAVTWIFILVGIMGLFLKKTLLVYGAKRTIRTDPSAGDLIENRIEEDGIHQHTRLVDADMSWDRFIYFVSSTKGALLYYQANMFMWIPSGAFESTQDYDRFTELAKRKIPKHGKSS